MSVAVFKPELWSRTILNELDVLTGLRKHSDYSFNGEIKYGTKLHITESGTTTIRDYVQGQDIELENYSGDEVVLEITEQKYFAKYYDNVDTVQSIKGVMENDMKQSAKELKLEADKFVAKKLAEAVEAGTIAKSASAITPNKSNVVEAVEAGLVALYENNVDPSTEVWGELSPKMYSHMRQHLTELATNNIELMKKGIIGRYNNVNVTIENLLPTKSSVRYNFLRTGKAFAFAEQIDQIKAVEKERGFGDIVKGLYVFGGVVVRAKEAYAIQETIA
jgi:hypothetical protein